MHTNGMNGFKDDMFSTLPNLYRERDTMGPMPSSAAKLDWLRSQIIGQNVEFRTPFGKRLLTYADHTASGRSLQFVENFIMEMVLPVYGNTHTDDSFVGTVTGNMMQEAEKYVKACMGGTEDDVLLFCGSGSTGAIKRLQEVMGIAVPSVSREHILSNLKKEHRWVVFTGPYEHHSNLLSWRNSLAEVVEIPLSNNGLVDFTSFKAALENPLYKGRPKLGTFSAASNVTGILSGTRKIARTLHAHGAFACFDFAACGPYVKIDMRSGEEDGYDAVFVSPHKFMGGPGTSGLLLFSKDLYLLKNGAPSTCGGGIVNYVTFQEENTIYVDEIAHREEAGTPPILQKIRTALAFSVKEFLTTELISSRETFFIEKALSRLGANPNIVIYGNTTVKRIAVVAFGIFPHLDLPTKVESQSDNEEITAHSPITSSDSGLSSDQQQLQWNRREKPRTNPAQKKKIMNIFTMNPFKQSVVGEARSPLRLLYKETQSPKASPKEEKTVQVDKAQGKNLDCRLIVKLLNDLFGIQSRGGCSCAGPYGHYLLGVNTDEVVAVYDGVKMGYLGVKPGWARLSFAYYISHEEFEFILSAIEFLAEFGPKFIQLYDLDWRTGEWLYKQNNRFRDTIADAEKKIFGEQKPWIWSKSPLLSGPAPFVSSTSFETPPIISEEYKWRLMAKYLKFAKYLADQLPLSIPHREIPTNVDHRLITFL